MALRRRKTPNGFEPRLLSNRRNWLDLCGVTSKLTPAHTAQLVLDAGYEATLLAGVLNSQRGGSNIVLLTLLGGGAFGNANEWNDCAWTNSLALQGTIRAAAQLLQACPMSNSTCRFDGDITL